MFSTARPKNAKKQTGSPVPFAVPFKGLNVRDPLVAMPPGYAFELVNSIPEQYGMRTRKGYTEWVTPLGVEPGPVHTIMVYYAADSAPVASDGTGIPNVRAMQKMFRSSVITPLVHFSGKVFAARGGKVYDVTHSGVDGALRVPEAGITGATAFWTSLMFQNVAGAFLLATNDSGGYSHYNGTVWATPAMGGGAGQIDGVNPALFCYVCEFKKRLWFVEIGSTRAWYLPVGQITGLAKMFNFGEQFNHGGHLVALANWTVDGGEGVDDYLVAVGSQGDVAIYKGTDPDTAATFAIHGVWTVGPLPAGRRSVSHRHGDVHILSQLGVVPVSKLLAARDQTEVSKISASYMIDPLVSRLMHDFSHLPGWQILDVDKEEMALIGVPRAAANLGGDFFALKLVSSGWTILRDLPYTSLVNVDSVVYAGTDDGRVVLAFNGPLDDVKFGSNTGRPIMCEVTPAYHPLGERVLQKRVVLMRPTFLASDVPILRFRILTDFDAPGSDLVPTLPTLLFDLWDEALWDVGRWSGLRPPIRKWLGARGVGVAATPQIFYACGGDTLLTSIDLWVEQGGPL